MISKNVTGLVFLLFLVSCAKAGPNILSGSDFSDAAALGGSAKVCNDPGGTKKTIEMPVDHFGYSDKKFTYTYQVRPGAKIGPSVIYIPGGPGGDSVATPFSDIFPSSFTSIFVDPRGVGCNFVGDDLPTIAISEANHIMDMVTLVKTLEPAQRDHLFVYGVSYGTIAGTLLVHRLESQGIRVKATILDGTRGSNNNPELSNSEQNMAMRRIIDRLFTDFPTIQTLVEGNSGALGIKRETLDNFILGGLYYDYKYVGEKLSRALELSSKPAPLSDPESAELKSLISKIEEKGKNGPSGLVDGVYGDSLFFKIVRCGNMGASAQNVSWCAGQPKLLGYDSKDYQLKSPIYYFQSKLDPATTYESAMYHFENQRAAQFKVFTVSENFGHGALHYPKQLRPCAEKLFTAIYQLKRDFKEILDQDGSCIKSEELIQPLGSAAP